MDSTHLQKSERTSGKQRGQPPKQRLITAKAQGTDHEPRGHGCSLQPQGEAGYLG